MPYDSEDAYSSDDGPYNNRDSDNSGSRGSKTKDALERGGSAIAKTGSAMIENAREQAASNMNRQTPVNLPSYRRGGKVRKTGVARVHKGEYVVPRSKVKKVKRAMKGRGM